MRSTSPFAVAFALALGACPICPDGEIEIVSGARDVPAGGSVQLRAHYGDWEQGPGNCGGVWAVNGIVAGDDRNGRIDTCGLYTAPSPFAADLTAIEVTGSEFPVDQCSDCCPFAAIALRPLR